MRDEKARLSAILLLALGLTGLQAQETIPASGGNASGNGGAVNYSVGQLVYITNIKTIGSVAQGVQQPYEISVVTGIKEIKGIALQCSIYPNPAADYVKLKVEDYKVKNFAYQLYDMNGKLLENKKIKGNETSIIMNSLAAATYFLKVTDGKKEIKTFKIIKN